MPQDAYAETKWNTSEIIEMLKFHKKYALH